MKNLICTIIALVVCVINLKTVEGRPSTIPYYMYNAATVFNIDIALLYALCTVESQCNSKSVNHNDGTKAQKKAGVISRSHGMFQLKLSTAKALGFKGKTASDLLKPDVNTWYAAKLLNHLYARYDDTTKVISAYNAGAYTKTNSSYVHKVLKEYIKYKIDKRL